MTRDEFNEWFLFHAASYAGIHTWLRKFPADPPEGMPGRGDILDAWARALSHTDLEAAKQASERMFAGLENEPRSYEKHPAAVAAIARKLRAGRGAGVPDGPHYVDGVETFHCPLCKDEGRVFVWHAHSMAVVAGLIAQGKSLGDGVPLFSAVVACTCRRGEQFRGRMATYNDRQWLVLSDGVEDERQKLVDFMAGYRQRNPAQQNMGF